jgi:peptidoglycan/LPS O-acetylase OafA/YrhL
MAAPKHKLELDGIRGIAILGVLITHSWAYIEPAPANEPLLVVMSFGQWGVDLFFALSGFLITGILLETKHATNYFRSFYARRALRIWPLYYTVLPVLFLAAAAFPWVAANMPVRAEWIGYMFYAQNIPMFWANGFNAAPHMIGHFWSLAVEEQFYFVWPCLIFFLSEAAVLWLCAAGFLLALPLRIYLYQHVFGSSWALMIVTPSRMDGLLIGSACAVLARNAGLFPARFIVATAAVGFAILAWIAGLHSPGEFIGSGQYMRTFGVTAVALLSGSLIGISQRHLPLMDAILTTPVLRFFGRYAYGIYVFHIPLFIVASRWLAPKLGIPLPLPLSAAIPFIASLNAVSVLVAVLSFELYEAKVLNLKRFFKPRFAEARQNAPAQVAVKAPFETS